MACTGAAFTLRVNCHGGSVATILYNIDVAEKTRKGKTCRYVDEVEQVKVVTKPTNL